MSKDTFTRSADELKPVDLAKMCLTGDWEVFKLAFHMVEKTYLLIEDIFGLVVS